MNNLSAATNNILMENFKNTDNITNDIGELIISAQQIAYSAVDKDIFHPVSGKTGMLLSWTHYRILFQVHNLKARAWYEKEAYEQTWSTKNLQGNVSYIYRMRMS